MRILILTQYFPPETGAPQNRLYEIAVRLQKEGDSISVLTAMPNYPKNRIFEGYRKKLFCSEQMEDLKIYRSFIYVGKSRAIISRLMNYFSFVFSSFLRGLFLKGKFDYILCESPPLFLGITAYFLSRLKGIKLIFNVSDLWPESAEKLEIINNKKLLKLAEKLELWLYKKSHVISGQTQGIVQSIKTRTGREDVIWLPNGVDPDFFNPEQIQENWSLANGFNSDDFLIFYAGIIGHAQGLEVILKASKLLEKEKKIKWLLIGDGPEKEKLQALAKKLACTQVYFFPNQAKKSMPEIVKACHASVIPLKRIPLFLGAIPSKLFEVLAMQKPILLGVEGEAKNLFIDAGQAGLAFEPENEHKLAHQALELFNNPEHAKKLGNNGLNYVKTYFNRNKIAMEFREKLYHYAQTNQKKSSRSE